jgi:hypothetical protein
MSKPSVISQFEEVPNEYHPSSLIPDVFSPDHVDDFVAMIREIAAKEVSGQGEGIVFNISGRKFPITSKTTPLELAYDYAYDSVKQGAMSSNFSNVDMGEVTSSDEDRMHRSLEGFAHAFYNRMPYICDAVRGEEKFKAALESAMQKSQREKNKSAGNEQQL